MFMTENIVAPTLDVVVTARPSWARVKSLVENYAIITDPSKIRVLFVGPAVSKRYGDVTSQVPANVEFETMQTLGESDGLDAVAQTCASGSQLLIHRWSSKRPDCTLVIADRTETLGVALAASVMQIPLVHLQGGEISGSIDDKIRDANSKLADLHLTTNEFTANRLISMGEPADRVIPIGCPSIDLVRQMIESDSAHFPENGLASELGGVGGDFSMNKPFGVIMFHPDTLNEFENYDWIKTLIEVADKGDYNWFWFWPNPDHGSHFVSHLIRQAREHGKLLNVRFVINLPPERFVHLASIAVVLVGNSSFGIRESAFLGLPVINLGKRQMGRQKVGNVRDYPDLLSADELRMCILGHASQGRFDSSDLYGDGRSGFRGASYIANWTPTLKTRPS
jgi:UDP-hydrolysing UDP-N-acetyl-D-glucosamine 2-epimerase